MEQIIYEIIADVEFPENVAWQKKTYNSGEKIIEKNQLGNQLYYIEKGQIRVLGGAEIDGDIKVIPGLCDLGVGALIGDVCLYGTHRRTASVVAISTVNTIEIRSDMLSEYLDTHPIQGYLFLKKLLKIVNERLELANERIDNLLAWGIKAHDIDKYL